MPEDVKENKKWPHTPPHIFNETGTFMVTGATLSKKHIFNDSDKLDLLQNHLLKLALDYGWNLEAWAMFPNHYHFVGFSKEPQNLNKFIFNFHGRTSYFVNKLDKTPGRQVWYQYWDTRLSYQKSHYARLNYVINNPVKHQLVVDPLSYEWSSAAWFEKNSPASFVNTVKSFKTDQLNIRDDF